MSTLTGASRPLSARSPLGGPTEARSFRSPTSPTLARARAAAPPTSQLALLTTFRGSRRWALRISVALMFGIVTVPPLPVPLIVRILAPSPRPKSAVAGGGGGGGVLSGAVSAAASEVNEVLADQLDPLLFGRDPTPGIVSVVADRQGRATVWRRLAGQVVAETDRFPNWFLLSDPALLQDFPNETLP